jgi:hypothetical protein
MISKPGCELYYSMLPSTEEHERLEFFIGILILNPSFRLMRFGFNLKTRMWVSLQHVLWGQGACYQ